MGTFQAMKDWFAKNIVGVALGGLTLMVIAAMFSLQGCALDEWISVRVPPAVQEGIKAPVKVSLADANYLYEKWQRFVESEVERKRLDFEAWASGVQADSRQFSESISRGWDTYSIVGSFIETGFGVAQAHASTLPGGMALVGLLGGLSGLMIRKPGTQKEIDSAYDEGKAEGARLALAGAAAVSGSSPSLLSSPVSS